MSDIRHTPVIRLDPLAQYRSVVRQIIRPAALKPPPERTVDMTKKRNSAAVSTSRSMHLLGELAILLRQASGYCCHHDPRHTPYLPHVIELHFRDMRTAGDCYHLLNEIARPRRRKPNSKPKGLTCESN